MAAAQVPVTIMSMTHCHCKVTSTCLSSMLKNMCAIIKLDKYTYLLYFSSISKAKAIPAGAGYI